MRRTLRTMTSWGAILAVALVLGIPEQARAQSGPKVRPPSRADVAAAKSGLDRGLVYLVETEPSGRLKQVTIFGRVNAPPETTFETLANPDLLLKMQPAMESVDVRAKRGNAITYLWHYGGTLVNVEGLTAMALAPNQAVNWGMTKGFGPGNLLWRLYPEGNQTLVALSMHIDVNRSGHTLIRWVSRSSPFASPMWNLGHGVLCLRGLQQVAATRAGRPGLPPPTGHAGSGPLRPLTKAQVQALRPLYLKGSAGIVEQDAQGRVAQASIIEAVGAPAKQVEAVVSDLARWDANLPEAVELERTDEAGLYHMEISTPGVSVDTNIQAAKVSGGVDVTSPSGSLRGSLIAFRVYPDGAGSVLTGSARFRARQGGRILRSMIDSDPYFGHGLNAGVLGVFSRGFKVAAER